MLIAAREVVGHFYAYMGIKGFEESRNGRIIGERMGSSSGCFCYGNQDYARRIRTIFLVIFFVLLNHSAVWPFEAC